MKKIKRQIEKPQTCLLNPETFKGSALLSFFTCGLKGTAHGPCTNSLLHGQIHLVHCNAWRTRLKTQAWKGFGSQFLLHKAALFTLSSRQCCLWDGVYTGWILVLVWDLLDYLGSAQRHQHSQATEQPKLLETPQGLNAGEQGGVQLAVQQRILPRTAATLSTITRHHSWAPQWELCVKPTRRCFWLSQGVKALMFQRNFINR